MLIVILGFACHTVKSSFQNTVDTCYHILEEQHLDPRFQDAVTLLAKYMENGLVEFSGCGFCNISKNTLGAIFVNSITYFIVIFQIENN